MTTESARKVVARILVRFLHPPEDADEVFRESMESYGAMAGLDFSHAPSEVVQRFAGYFTDHIVEDHLEDLVWCSLDTFTIEEAARAAAQKLATGEESGRLLCCRAERKTAKKMNGTVTRLIANKGYGFVRGSDGISHFMHVKDVLPPSSFELMHEGQAVSFTPVDGLPEGNGHRAIKVRLCGPDGLAGGEEGEGPGDG